MCAIVRVELDSTATQDSIRVEFGFDMFDLWPWLIDCCDCDWLLLGHVSEVMIVDFAQTARQEFSSGLVPTNNDMATLAKRTRLKGPRRRIGNSDWQLYWSQLGSGIWCLVSGPWDREWGMRSPLWNWSACVTLLQLATRWNATQIFLHQHRWD